MASKNPDKIREIEDVLATTGLTAEIVRGLDWPDVEETGATLEENALLKGRAMTEATGLPSLADDTGLEVDALGGQPGVRSSRFAGEDAGYGENRELLLTRMSGVEERSARFRTVVALVFPDGVEVTAEGTLEGWITEAARGQNGFGYDPLFAVEGRTLAEMTMEEKSALSHRARAIRSLVDSLGL